MGRQEFSTRIQNFVFFRRTNVLIQKIQGPSCPSHFPADQGIPWNGRSLGSAQPSCPIPVSPGTLAQPQPIGWRIAETPHVGPALLRNSQSLGLGPNPLQPPEPSTAGQGLPWTKGTPSQPHPGQGGSGGSSHLCYSTIQ